MLFSLVDAAMVGRLEEAAYTLATMGLGVFATWVLVGFSGLYHFIYFCNLYKIPFWEMANLK